VLLNIPILIKNNLADAPLEVQSKIANV